MIFGQLDIGAASETELCKAPYPIDADVYFCNRNGTAALVRMRIVPADVATATDAMYLWYDVSIPATTSMAFDRTLRLQLAERLLVYSGSANVSIVAIGEAA